MISRGIGEPGGANAEAALDQLHRARDLAALLGGREKAQERMVERVGSDLHPRSNQGRGRLPRGELAGSFPDLQPAGDLG